MSDFESFSPSSGGEAYDPAAFERFKEQIKKNAAFMAAAKKGEQKQKQKEDRLARILLKFIKSNQQGDIVMLASRLLEENIPASLVLAIIMLGNEELKLEVKAEGLLLKESQQNGVQTASGKPEEQPSAFAIAVRISDATLPLKIKVEIDMWAQGIFEAGSASPFRVLETALDNEGNIKKVVIACTANVLSSYIEKATSEKADYDAYYSFSELLIKGVMQKLQQQIKNQKELN